MGEEKKKKNEKVEKEGRKRETKILEWVKIWPLIRDKSFKNWINYKNGNQLLENTRTLLLLLDIIVSYDNNPQNPSFFIPFLCCNTKEAPLFLSSGQRREKKELFSTCSK